MAERELTLAGALREALEEEMRGDPRVFLMGQDIRYSVWGVTGGLHNDFGADRVLHLPISENGFSGAAVGAALTGMRPVVEFMYGDFLLLAMDSIGNQAAKYRYMCGGGDFKVPVTFRLAGCGIGSGSGCHHSQYPEAWGMHFPGLKIVAPSNPYDAKGLLKAAIRDDDPVLFFEYKQLYRKKGPVPQTEYVVPLGQAAILREGTDVTIVTFACGCDRALAAADRLAEEGVGVEVVDLRTIKPLDRTSILASVQKTGRLVVLEDGCRTGGVGAEVAALVAEEALPYLNAPIRRLAGADTVIPAGRHAEKMVVPSEDDVYLAVQALI